jgi:hypothetical protein
MINGRFAVASLPSSSAGMPPELVEEFPEGHKEAAELARRDKTCQAN